MTKQQLYDIIFKRLRECWNGRQARLRCVWFRRVGSSPISRTITDTVIDTIVSVTVSAFLCPFYEYWGEFRTLQHCFVDRIHDVVVLHVMGVVDQLHIVVSIR